MSQLATANPTARYTVTCGSHTITQSDPKGLELLVIEDHLDLIGICELTFVEGSGFSWSSVTQGDPVDVVFGGSPRKAFSGVIVGFRHQFASGKQQLTVSAMDPLVFLAASRRTATWEDLTDSDIVSDVLARATVTPGVVDATSDANPYVFQRNESDLGFLRRLAARNGHVLMANEGKVDWKKMAFTEAPTEVPKASLVSLDYGMQWRSLPPSVTARGWDYLTKEIAEGTAADTDVDPIGSGSTALSQAGTIWKAPSWLSDVHVTTPSRATAMALADLEQPAHDFLRGTAVVQGTGALFAGTRIKFTEHPTGFNPDVVVVSARHRVVAGAGSRTEVAFCGNTLPA